MFVMLPVMFLARKLDGEDPNVVYYLRIAYGAVQTLCVMAVLYTYIQARTVAGKFTNRIVYVPPPPTVSHLSLFYLCVLRVVLLLPSRV